MAACAVRSLASSLFVILILGGCGGSKGGTSLGDGGGGLLQDPTHGDGGVGSDGGAGADGGPGDHQPLPDAGGGPQPGVDAGTPGRHARVNPIPAENARPGASDWRITQNTPGHDIEGYSSAPSATPGQRIPFSVSVQPAASTFTWRAYRLGYYGGLGAREVARCDDALPVSPQPACPKDPSTGLVQCNWPMTFTLQTESSWVPGIYLLRLTKADGFQRFVPFFVRDDTTYPQVLVDVATSTWQAYNQWGGTSLYDDEAGSLPGGHAVKVSYDRPYDRDSGAGQVLEYEHNLVKWLEAQGVDVAYATTEDLDRDASLYYGPQVLLLPGHDEYWTRSMRARMDDAVARGVSLLLFGANAGYWQVRMDAAPDGRDRRLITGYKDLAKSSDPVGPNSPDLTCRFRDLAAPKPENALFGVMFDERWNQWGMPVVVDHTDHWIFNGTGLQPGDTLLHAAGYEVDQLVPDNGFQPANVELLTNSPILSLVGAFGRAHMVVRQQGSAYVFAAGGVEFVRGLASDDAADPRLQRLAANVLYRALGQPVPSSLKTFTSPPPTIVGRWARAAAVVGGVRASAADVDGSATTGRLEAPIGVAALPNGCIGVLDVVHRKVKKVDGRGNIATIATGFDLPMAITADGSGNMYVAENESGVIEKVTPTGSVSTFAGIAWQGGSKDGPATQATFVSPAGMAVSPRGLMVADVGAGTIRLIDLTGSTHNVTTLVSGLYRPSGIAVASNGTAYIVESGNSRILSLSTTNQVHVVTGGLQGAGYADGAPGQSALMPFLGIAVLGDGTLAVADAGTGRIRRVDPATGNVSTLAGTGRAGVSLGTGDVTDLVLPGGLAVASDGRLLVAEPGNADILALTP